MSRRFFSFGAAFFVISAFAGCSVMSGTTDESSEATLTALTHWRTARDFDLGVFRNGQFFLSSKAGGDQTPAMSFGQSGDVPFLGTVDFADASAPTWSFVVYRPSEGRFMGPTPAPGWEAAVTDVTTDVPVLGVWSKGAAPAFGLFRNGLFQLDTNGDNRISLADKLYHLGAAGDIPVIGDWNGDGQSDLGVFHAGAVVLDRDGNGEITPDEQFTFGQTGDIPVAFWWNGADHLAVYRSSEARFYLDMNGDFSWDDAHDTFVRFGNPGDVPVRIHH